MIKMLDPKTFTVLVTGATAGFGAAMCRRFAGSGAKVIATGRRKDRLDALKKELGANCHTAVLDVTDKKAVDALAANLPAGFAKVNVVVANAGLALGLEPAQKANMSDWEQMIATNINGLLYTDFRQARRPQENLNFGRNFRIKESINLQIRAEFVNIFNRTQIGNPVTSNPLGLPTQNRAGQYTGGFGVINETLAVGATPSFTANAVVGQLYQQPRSGTLIARFTF